MWSIDQIQTIVALGTAFVGGIIWLYAIKNKQDGMGVDVEKIQKSLDAMKAEVSAQKEKLVEVVTKVDILHEQMTALDQKLTRLLERQSE